MRRLFLPLSLLLFLGLNLMGPAHAGSRVLLRVSTPAVSDDWHAKMWTVFKESLDKQAPGEFDVQIHLNGTLFRQGAEPTAMARGNLEMASVSAFDLARQVPDFSILTAGYVIRDPKHQQAVLNGPIGESLYRQASERMGLHVLAPLYLGTRQLGLRSTRKVQTPADLQGVKLRMPSSKEWLFLGNALGASAMPLSLGEVYMGLKTGTIDAEDNPLPTLRATKFNEVLAQIVLTQHLVDSLFITLADKTWQGLSPTQQTKVRDAAQAAARFNNDHRLQEEAQLLEAFKKQGLTVTTPDVAAFRQKVQATYSHSDYARSWSAGLLDRIQAAQ
ncbi:MAG: TRAP transporter substrate-binding protein DctP [Leptothrix ochracea]|uniref:TRAP transporter substrate-binding protein DctP n=1 Tax=Leptothrix ochracea TaxID=735331 RepID=UPI0034E2F3BF